MPTFDFKCAGCESVFPQFLALADTGKTVFCQCGSRAEKHYTRMPGTHVASDVCYDSPIDGRPITNRRAREEDLKRNGCVEYDPEMKTDYARRVAREDRDMDRASDDAVERFVAELPSAKRETLASELESGVDLQTVRT